MTLLHGRVVLITDSGDPIGRAAAYATSAAGAFMIVNDPVGAGTVRSASEALLQSLKRRGGQGLSSAADLTRFRQCISMIQLGFDRMDWISGIVHVDRDNGQSLSNIIRAASHPMKKWGGTMVVLNASDEAVEMVQKQAASLREGRLLINCVRPSDELAESLTLFLMSPESIRANVFGKVIPPQNDLSAAEVGAQIHDILANADKPAAKEPAAKPAAKKPAAKPAAKKPAAKKPAAKKPAAKKPAAKKPAARRKGSSKKK